MLQKEQSLLDDDLNDPVTFPLQKGYYLGVLPYHFDLQVPHIILWLQHFKNLVEVMEIMYLWSLGFPGDTGVKNPLAGAGDAGDWV